MTSGPDLDILLLKNAQNPKEQSQSKSSNTTFSMTEGSRTEFIYSENTFIGLEQNTKVTEFVLGWIECQHTAIKFGKLYEKLFKTQSVVWQIFHKLFT